MPFDVQAKRLHPLRVRPAVRYRDRFQKCLDNPTDEQVFERDPLCAFSHYLSGRVSVLCVIGDEIVENLEIGFSTESVCFERIERAESLMWLWILGAYEVVRTMHQAKQCFSERIVQELLRLKKLLATVRMPAAKMEKPGVKIAVTSNRSPCGLDLENRDLLVNDPEEDTSISARYVLNEFDSVFCSILRADVLAQHETSYAALPNFK